MTERFSMSSFIIGVILGALLAAAWFSGSGVSRIALSPVFSAVPSSSDASSTPPSESESGAVSVADQPSGDSVVVESVTVPPPGVWVAVRETDGTALGNVLGALRVGGPRSQVTIPLLRGTEPGRAYAIELYRDDNGDGGFDPTKNSVYIDFTTGEPVIARFVTTD